MSTPTDNRGGLGLIGTIIAIGLLVVFLGGGPYLIDTIQKSPLLTNSTSTNPIDQAKQVISQLMQKGGEEQKQIEQLSSSSTIETSAWKTYRNEKYGFEVSYPFEWRDYEHKESSSLLSIFSKDRADISFVVEKIKAVTPSQFLIEENKRIDELNAYLATGPGIGGIEISKPSIINFANKEATLQYQFAIGFDGKVITIPSQGLSIYFSYGGRNPTSSIPDQILSTFKFIEPIDTSTWKTYRNEKYGFEIKYPPVRVNQKVEVADSKILFKANTYDPNRYSEFLVIGVFENEEKLSISNWFKKSLDKGDILLRSGAFKEVQLANEMWGIVNTDNPIPPEYDEPVSFTHIVISPDRKFVFVFHPLGQNAVYIGNSDEPISFANLFNEWGFSTFKFTK